MKLAVLHLSDIHIKSKNNSVFEKEEAIFNAIKNEIKDFKYLFVVFTGDMAYSGQKNEYEIVKSFCNLLKDRIERYCSSTKIEFIFTAGNHDCNFNENQEIRNVVIKSVLDNPTGITESIINNCTQIQHEYFNFIETFKSYKSLIKDDSNNLLQIYKFNIDNFSIIFNSFNTAWMSKRKEKQSEILFPINCINKENLLETQSSLTFSIFHHPKHWLNHRNIREFKELVEASSDIILTGHEHVSDAMKQQNIYNTNEIEYVEGGILQDSYKNNISQFNLLLIDLKTKKHDIFVYEWEKSIYEKKANEDILLPVCNKTLFQFKPEYYKDISSLELKFNHPRKEDLELEDIYVFPDLKAIEININKTRGSFTKISAKELIKECQVGKSIQYGKDNAGKTSLARMMQINLKNKGLIPLLLNGRNIQKTERKDFIKNILKKAFKEQYQQNGNILTSYEQEDINNIVIILDDFQNIKLNNEFKGKFVNNLEDSGYKNIILFADSDVQLEAISESALSKSLQDFNHYEILELGHKPREELIRKWILLGQETEIEMEELVKLRRERALIITQTIGLNFIPSFPFYLLMLLQAMDVNDKALENSSYGHYYRFLILQYLNNTPYTLKEKDINTIFGYASTLSFKMFKDRVFVCDINDFNQFDSEYKKAKAFTPKYNILKILIDSGIFAENDGEYRFSHKYLYYYFVAYFFSKNVDKPEITQIIDKMTERLYRIEFANILMFIFHLSPQSRIIEMLNREAKKIFKGLSEFKFEYTEIKQLNSLIQEDVKNKLENRSLEESREIEVKEEERSSEMQKYINGDDQEEAYYDEVIPTLDIFKQVNLAFRLTDILGEIVKNYAGTLDREPKYKLIKSTYGMGLRSMKKLISGLEDNHKIIIEELESRIDKSKLPSEANSTEIINQFVFGLAQNIMFGITRRIAKAIGDQELKGLYNDIQKEDPDNTAYKLIQQAINMRFQNGLNKTKLLKLNDEFKKEKNILTTSVLKRLVMEHLYMYNIPHDKKIAICVKLDISMDEMNVKRIENK